ncbi:hypothetical protein EDD30_5497 [Couchioplanes caeruleus]|uniref:Uncharacterized protein n=1 Tax=Couchioplanes caeruleus TaxID=56438 RepID=A0A3N1GQN1_9ACTN|nr:hypothetical protein EDD30_5497 [Couchioplanes caeruleus]
MLADTVPPSRLYFPSPGTEGLAWLWPGLAPA